MICCKCGGVFYQTSRCKVREEGVIQRHYYKCNKTVRKELKNCYENCFGTVGNHADTGA